MEKLRPGFPIFLSEDLRLPFFSQKPNNFAMKSNTQNKLILTLESLEPGYVWYFFHGIQFLERKLIH